MLAADFPKGGKVLAGFYSYPPSFPALTIKLFDFDSISFVWSRRILVVTWFCMKIEAISVLCLMWVPISMPMRQEAIGKD